jgi:hypothetical protein
VAASRKKSSSWLIPSRSASSPSTPASTSKNIAGRARFGAASTRHARAQEFSKTLAKLFEEFWSPGVCRLLHKSEDLAC